MLLGDSANRKAIAGLLSTLANVGLELQHLLALPVQCSYQCALLLLLMLLVFTTAAVVVSTLVG